VRLNRACAASIALAMASLTSTSEADEASKRACVRDNEEGQDLRRGGKLVEARGRFASCSSPKCPKVLREDCVTRREEVQRALPSVVLVISNAQDELKAGISLAIDGAPLTQQQSDEIELDPGEHTFEIAAPGRATIIRRVTVQEGIKRREEVITLPAADASPGATPSNAIRTGLAYGAAGVGVVLLGVGTYFVFAADSTYRDARDARERCPLPPIPCNDDPDALERRADNQSTVAAVTITMGVLSLAGGLALYLTTPKGRAVTVVPSISLTAAALGARTTF
jgi:hypothetical protein